MTERQITVTYRDGKIFAAYVRLRGRRLGEKVAKSVEQADGLMVVDYLNDGRPLGIELQAPHLVTLQQLNALLVELGEPPLAAREYKPLKAA